MILDPNSSCNLQDNNPFQNLYQSISLYHNHFNQLVIITKLTILFLLKTFQLLTAHFQSQENR